MVSLKTENEAVWWTQSVTVRAAAQSICSWWKKTGLQQFVWGIITLTFTAAFWNQSADKYTAGLPVLQLVKLMSAGSVIHYSASPTSLLPISAVALKDLQKKQRVVPWAPKNFMNLHNGKQNLNNRVSLMHNLTCSQTSYPGCVYWDEEMSPKCNSTALLNVFNASPDCRYTDLIVESTHCCFFWSLRGNF